MNFSNKYNKSDFLKFFQGKFLPDDFSIEDENISIDFTPFHIKKVTLIGKVDSLDLKIYEVKHKSEYDPRVSLSKEIFKVMRDYSVRNALILFISENSDNYRFSLATISFSLDDKKVKKEYSNPRRYSFFLGPDAKTHTPEKYLQRRVKDFEDLMGRFSIEVVNKEFFEKISYSFYSMIGKEGKFNRELHLPYVTDDEMYKDFAMRTIGRLIFCWFLKKKSSVNGIPLISDEILSKEAVLTNKNYYHNVLEVLFFELLNTPIEKRNTKFRTKIYDNVPFLNGGLFQPHDNDFYITALRNALIISNDWFVKIFDTFEIYNFTIDENTSVDIELSIDPEMLGRIFENLLAELNPETEINARKIIGAYYTPREIVDYMVEKSLKETIISNLGIDNTIVEEIFSFDTDINKVNNNIIQDVIKFLANIKILDPACGSGAYPIGILQKIISLLEKLDPEANSWIEEKIKIQNNSFLQSALDKKRSVNYNNYLRKFAILQDSIFGLDINPIGIELSKLRSFLTLIVDEDIDDSKENRGVIPLPNLEFKFICANSLKSVPKQYIESTLFKSELLKLKKNIDDYYSVHSEKKKKVSEEIKKIIDIITDQNQKHINDITTKIKLKSYTEKKTRWEKSLNELIEINTRWESYKNIFHDKKVDFFETEYFFPQVENGFDIIIGNPPYIKEYTNRSAFDGLRETECYQGKMDIWYYFACRFLSFLKPETGILTFIATNNWVSNAGASVLRETISQNAQILQLIDFGNYKIFESADIQTMIMIFKNTKKSEQYDFDFRRIIDTEVTLKDVISVFRKYKSGKSEFLEPEFNREYFRDKSFLFSDVKTELLLEKIQDSSNFMLNGKTEIAQGIVAPQDSVNKASLKKLGGQFVLGEGIFVLSNDEKERLRFAKQELSLIKPFYKPEQLKRISGESRNTFWIIYTDSSFKNPEAIAPYPNIKKHLDRFRSVITSDNAPYGLHRSREENFFKGEKIMSLRKCIIPTFTFTDFDCYVAQTFFIIKTKRVNLKFLTVLLNSKVIAYWLKHKGKMQGFQYQIDKEPLESLPLIVHSNTKIFEDLVDYIILINQNDYEQLSEFVSNDQIVKTFEDLIDGCVYELYFEEEMKSKQINILELARELIKPVSNLESTSKKLSVIRKAFSELKDPDNEIRNRMKLFAIESKETILPIQKIY